MGRIEIPADVLEEMKAHAAEGYPHEVVGVMAGDWGETKRVRRLFRGSNQFRLAEEMGEDAAAALRDDLEVEGSSANRFFMTGDEMRAVDAACRAEGLDILGFYHTHPDHPSRPSATDLRFAQQTLPGYSYVIMSVERGVPSITTCWVLSDDESRFEEEAMSAER
jgi:proteasome lid subunit RPN8/RPN11